MKKFKIKKFLSVISRLHIFAVAYLLYLLQLILILFNLKNFAKKLFNAAAYFCSISLGINYEIEQNFSKIFLKEGIHISNHDNPLDIFVAQTLFKIKTITTVDTHLKNFLPFF